MSGSTMNFMPTNALNFVNIEVSDEFMVQEIQPNGVEIQKQPLSMSENFTKIIQRIDFDKLEKALAEGENNNSTPKNVEEIEIPEVKIPVQSFINQSARPASSTPYAPQLEVVKQKFTNALSHICVMHDIIKIGREHSLIAFDHAPAKDPNPSRVITEQKLITNLIAKKKGLQSAAHLISNSLENIKEEQARNGRSRADFHQELLSMRQIWRLRKKGPSIIGDLSYRTSGSTHIQPARFEVIRNENPGPQNQSTLKLIVPKSLEGTKFLVIKHITNEEVKLSDFIESTEVSCPIQPQASANVEQHWNTKLESIQKSIFIKGLFTHLGKESVLLNLPLPAIATGNQILVSHFPGAQLSIKIYDAESNADYRNFQEFHRHDIVLEHTLHQLLLEVYYRNLHASLPHPTSVSLTANSVKYNAGVNMLNRTQLSSIIHKDMILEQIIKQAKHKLLKNRVAYEIDHFCVNNGHGLLFVPSWNHHSSPTMCSVKIDIYSPGFEGITGFRTCVMCHIGHQSITAIMKDGRAVNLSYNPTEFQYLLLNLASQHEVLVIQALGKSMAWKILLFSPHVGVGQYEPLCGTSSSTCLLSPDGSKRLCIRSGPMSGVSVGLSTKRKNAPENEPQYTKPEKILFDGIPGKSFISKMEFIMAYFG